MAPVPAKDDRAFAEVVARLADDPAERGRLAAGGLALFERRYAWAAIAGSTLEKPGESAAGTAGALGLVEASASAGAVTDSNGAG